MRLTLLLLFASMMATVAPAQVQPPGPYHLARLRGVFVDEQGNPIPDAAVSLDQDDKAIYSTKTDRTGRFEIKHASGRFSLHIDKSGYSIVRREVIVGVEAATYLHIETLYVISGPGACTDDCSQIFTSESKFEKAIRKDTKQPD
jgi:hypothetical protein